MPFFIAGYEMKEFFKRDLSFYVVLIIFVALIVFNYYNGRVDINTCQIGNSLLLFYLNGTFGTICVFQIARYLQNWYVDIIGYQLFVVNTVEKWMCFLLAYGRKPRFNVFNLILQEKCEFEVAK